MANIAVAGTGYVGLSLAVLLSQHNQVKAVDVVKEKVDKINRFESPIQDDYIEKFFSEARMGERKLDLSATTDGDSAYKDADFVIVSTPTNYDSQKNFSLQRLKSLLRCLRKVPSKKIFRRCLSVSLKLKLSSFLQIPILR